MHKGRQTSIYTWCFSHLQSLQDRYSAIRSLFMPSDHCCSLSPWNSGHEPKEGHSDMCSGVSWGRARYWLFRLVESWHIWCAKDRDFLFTPKPSTKYIPACLGVAHPPWIEFMSKEKERLNPGGPHFRFAMGPAWASLVPHHIRSPVKSNNYPEHSLLIAMAKALEPKQNCTSPFQASAQICPLKQVTEPCSSPWVEITLHPPGSHGEVVAAWCY